MERIYGRIADGLAAGIGAGQFRKGERLPSVRDLCEQYGISVNTAVKVYEELKLRGLVYAVPQSGYYILEHRHQTVPEASGQIDFSRGNPVLDTICMPDATHCIQRAVEMCQGNGEAWHDLYGTPSLRTALMKYLTDFQIFTRQENIFVNLGVRQALGILQQMPFPNGKEKILVEQPTYRYYLAFLKANQVVPLTIERGPKGIDTDQLEDLFRRERIKFFYTVPDSHNPLGTSYSVTQRKEIAGLAEKYDVYIVEDDYFGDVGLRQAPIYSYGDHRHHIYLKSFIKIIPWIRIGIAVLPAELIAPFTAQMKASYCQVYFSPSSISQATLEIYIRSGLLKKHTAILEKELTVRQAELKSFFYRAAEYGAAWSGGDSGFYAYLYLPEKIKEAGFVANLAQKLVTVTAGRECFVHESPVYGGIRVSVARVKPEEIQQGMEMIHDELARWR